VRPLLKPALRRLWRDSSSLQLGVDPGRALILQDLAPPQARLLLGLDGTATREEVLQRAAGWGLDPSHVADMLDQLAGLGMLEDADLTRTGGLGDLDRDRLAPDLAALSLARRDPGGAHAALARRRQASVVVEGGGRLGAAVAALVAAAGVGQVRIDDPRPLSAADLGPCGPGVDALGSPRAEAALAAVRRSAPATRPDAGPAAVTVLADEEVLRPARHAQLSAQGATHLAVTTLGGGAVVGPLVRPGRSPCRRCVDLHLADFDGGWPRLMAQLSSPPAPTAPCDVVLATAAAALAARLVLDQLDAGAVPGPGPALVWVFGAGEPTPSQRAYGFHPACGCQWGGQH